MGFGGFMGCASRVWVLAPVFLSVLSSGSVVADELSKKDEAFIDFLELSRTVFEEPSTGYDDSAASLDRFEALAQKHFRSLHQNYGNHLVEALQLS